MKLATWAVGAGILVGCDFGGREAEALRAELEASERATERLQQDVARLTAELASAREAAAPACPEGLDPQQVKELLALLDKPQAGGVSLLDQLANGTLPATEPTVPLCREDRCTVPRATFTALIDDPEALSKSARIMPSVVDGETRGFKVYGIRTTSPLKAFGLQNGDLLTAIAGKPIRTLDDVVAVRPLVTGSAEWTIAGERAGTPYLRTIVITD